MKKFIYLSILIFASIAIFALSTCSNKSLRVNSYTNTIDSLIANPEGKGNAFTISFTAGKAHNHPSFVIWLQDMDSNFIQTLFITKSFGTGIFGHADAGNGKWNNKPGESLRKAALPYWTFNRGINTRGDLMIPVPEAPVTDAYTGATPGHNFVIHTKADNKIPEKFRILFEINQPWDWNEYWSNNKYPNNRDYISSCQPSLVYATDIDLNNKEKTFELKPIGHGHFAGENGRLYTDLSTLTTALQITQTIIVTIK